MCGEKRKTGAVPAPLPGSPPRVRGKGLRHAAVLRTAGITPAYAGKILHLTYCPQNSWDHPRVCGEKSSLFSTAALSTGSPPRVRGKDDDTAGVWCQLGITPACAGKRDLGNEHPPHPRDHPRVCGEKMVSMIPHRRSRGSPPRMRGKVQTIADHLLQQGITPAYAGKRVSRSPAKTGAWNHPRVCGEKAFGCRRCTFPQGSPPRMRGKV